MARVITSLLAVVAVAAAATSFATASGASYTVGEPGGSWDLQTNFTTWASSITFRLGLGDQLVFKYSPAAHDVVEVTEDGYLSCSPSSPTSALRTGQDAVQLGSLGSRYFICGVPGHCAAGMKLQVRVVCGATGVTVTPAGDVCIDGLTPTTIITTGSYNSALGSSGSASSALVTAATMLLLGLIMV